MFTHNFKYAMKTMLKNKTALIWTLLFPLALGTFMYMAFGSLFEKESMFHVIPVAIVEKAENETFQTTLEKLSEEGEEQLLQIAYMSEEEALSALEEESVAGIIYIDEDLSLTISSNSYNSTVLKSILTEYKKQETVLTDIAQNHPEALADAIDNLISEETFFTEKTTSEGNQDVYSNYFYAIFAMSCLFASFASVEKIGNLQANVSALGMRRCMSPNNKATIIVTEFLSLLISQFTVEVIALIYFSLIGIDFGNKYPQMLGILFFGSAIGVALGSVIGAIPKLSFGAKSGICILTSMVLSVMADLVAAGIKDSIEHVAPIINRLNPAALIADSFYALNIYDTYDRYIRNMATLGIMTVLLLTISFLILRRNRYASV